MRDWQPQLAKSAIFTRFCTLFGAKFHPKERGEISNGTWSYDQNYVELWRTLRGAFAKTMCFGRFLATF